MKRIKATTLAVRLHLGKKNGVHPCTILSEHPNTSENVKKRAMFLYVSEYFSKKIKNEIKDIDVEIPDREELPYLHIIDTAIEGGLLFTDAIDKAGNMYAESEHRRAEVVENLIREESSQQEVVIQKVKEEISQELLSVFGHTKDLEKIMDEEISEKLLVED
jgi:hypothetical protein